ncbi:MAG: AAA family ATPase [Bryobacteraceae bacterium]
MFSSPAAIENLGIPEILVHDLFLKHVSLAGTCTMRSIAGTLKLSVDLIHTVFHRMKSQQLIEVKGMVGDDYSFSLSPAGKNAAQERMRVSRYAGPVPVSLAQYESAVRAQIARFPINRKTLCEAYRDLTLGSELLDQLGPALVSRRSMFLFGPSGTGKSSLAERLFRISHDSVAVPYTIEVDGNMVVMFDPSVHTRTDSAPPDHDPRWVFCSRPSIIVGGELVPGMLELQRDPETGSYVAPMHMKANNGVFVIDDFGRQMISPRDLLNRWIVPLDRRLDYLSMSNGLKFAIPFEVFVVFSTNLNPTELADEAFLRRIPNKILVDAIPPQAFDEIVRRRLESMGWPAEPEAAVHLRELCKERGGDLRPCYPRDVFRIIESIALFEERTPALSVMDIDRAGELYFGRLATASGL